MSEVKMNDEQFAQFKTLFSMFVEQEFRACSTFTNALSKCKSAGDIERLLKLYDDEILDRLGIDVPDEDELDDAKNDLEVAEDKVLELEHEIKRYKGRTLDSVMKLESFAKHRENYLAHDFEYLMEHGHELLKQKKTA